MSSDVPKKMIIPFIIEVLRKYTDADHVLKQEEISKKLKSDYNLTVNRKTLSRNLKQVMYYDPEHIKCSIRKRNGEEIDVEDDEESAVYTDFYYEHEFEKSELQSLIYNVIFAKHISRKQKEEIVKKLEKLWPSSIRHNLKHYILDTQDPGSEFSPLFYNLEEIDRAISDHRVIEFQYGSYDENLKFHIDGRVWKVFPFGIAANNNDFYLVGLVCGSSHSSPEDLISDVKKLIENVEQGSRFLDTFRIDRIRELCITDNEEMSNEEKRIVASFSLKDINHSWNNVFDYARQNSSLSPGRSITAKLVFKNDQDGNLSDAIDYFGKANIRIEKSENAVSGEYRLVVRTNDRAMKEFAKTYARNVVVLEPEYLREELCEIYRIAYETLSRSDVK